MASVRASRRGFGARLTGAAPFLALLCAIAACRGAAPEEKPPDSKPPDPFYALEWRPLLLPPTARPGAHMSVQVSVRNLGREVWRNAGGPNETGWVRLALRWSVEGAAPLRDSTVPLPRSLEPGEWGSVTLDLVAPDRPGDYVLQVDLERVGEALFASRGAAKKLALLRVE